MQAKGAKWGGRSQIQASMDSEFRKKVSFRAKGDRPDQQKKKKKGGQRKKRGVGITASF